MKEYVAIIAAAVAGVFALISAVAAWRLKSFSDERTRKISLEKDRRDELKQLYQTTLSLFEQAIRQVKHREKFSLAREFSETTAKMHLLAPERVAEQYLQVAHQLEEWSHLHAKASPREMELAGQTVMLIQSPDPTAPYKEPAKAAFEQLQSKLQEFTTEMRQDLS